MAARNHHRFWILIAGGLMALWLWEPAYAAVEAEISCAKDVVNGTGVPQTGQRITLLGRPDITDKFSSRFPFKDEEPVTAGLIPETLLDYFGASIGSGEEVRTGFKTFGNDFELTDWVWTSGNGTTVPITPSGLVPDPGFEFQGSVQGGTTAPLTAFVQMTMRNGTGRPVVVDRGRFSQGASDPGLRGINTKVDFGQGERPLLIGTGEFQTRIIPTFVLAPGAARTFVVQLPGGAGIEPGADLSSIRIFFRATGFLVNDVLHKAPAFLAVWCNPFGKNPPILGNPRASSCGDVMTNTGHRLANVLMLADARDPDNSVPFVRSVEITPIGHSGLVFFNPATDVQRIATTDENGRPIATILMHAFAERARFQILQYRVRVTVQDGQGEQRTRDFTLTLGASG